MRRFLVVTACFLLVAGVATTQAQDKPLIQKPPKQAESDDLNRAERLGEGIELPTGPMRVEFWAVLEQRDYYKLDPPPGGPKFSMMVRMRLTGERLLYLSGCGELIIEQLTDETGKVLKSIEDYAPAELSRVRPLRSGKTMLRIGYADRFVETVAADRKASKLDLLKGYVNVVYAESTEVIMIDNPFQYMGGYIKHPVLEKMGLKIKVVDPEGKRAGKREFGGISLQYEGETQKYIRKVDFYDSWLKPMYTRETEKEAEGIGEYSLFTPVGGKMDCDVQMLLRYYPEIEEERISFEYKDIPLP